MKGQSDYESPDFHMGLFFDMSGFASGDYNTIVMPDDVTEGDPFLLIAGESKPTWNPGSQNIEIGLWDDYRIKIDNAGIWGWDEADTQWIDLLIGGESYLEYTTVFTDQINETHLTMDGAWHEIDLDSYITVPDGVIGVIFTCGIVPTTAGDNLRIRGSHQTDDNVHSTTRGQVATIWMENNIVIPLNSSHTFDYKANTTLIDVTMNVLWWIYGKVV